MSFDMVSQIINKKFQQNWLKTKQESIEYGGNHNFNPPTNEPWVRIVINVISTENAEVGTSFQRSRGKIIVQCFAPIGAGEKTLYQMFEAVKEVFQNKNLGNFENSDSRGNIVCYATNLIRVGASGNWYQFNASTDFQYDVFC